MTTWRFQESFLHQLAKTLLVTALCVTLCLALQPHLDPPVHAWRIMPVLTVLALFGFCAPPATEPHEQLLSIGLIPGWMGRFYGSALGLGVTCWLAGALHGQDFRTAITIGLMATLLGGALRLRLG